MRWSRVAPVALSAGALLFGACRQEGGPARAPTVPLELATRPIKSPPPRPLPAFAGRVQKLSAAHDHTCALLLNGATACWGAGIGPASAATPGAGPTDVVRPEIAAGVPLAIDLAVGANHACVAKADGEVVCWGSSSYGQLGSSEAEPAAIAGVRDVVELSSRADHTCARRRDGHVLCWGKGDEGQLGVVTDAGSDLKVPIEVPDLDDAVEISTGLTTSCARRASGGVVCWGGQTHARASSLRPISGSEDAVQISVRGTGVCFVRANGNVTCSGPDGPRTLHLSTGLEGDPAVSLVNGSRAECVLRRSGQVWCRGASATGDLGDGDDGPHRREALARVSGIDDARQLVGYGSGFCALRRSGEVACWGSNARGQLGIGWDERQTEPFELPGLSASKVVVAPQESCALGEGLLRCWGRDASREPSVLAASPEAPRGLQPASSASAPTSIVDVALGRSHGCAVARSGEVQCWGLPSTLGAEGTGIDASVHTVPNLADAVAVATGETHTCARRKNGRVVCWGQNHEGELGDAIAGATFDPVEIAGLDGVVEIAAGRHHTCVRRKNGVVACWGANADGQGGAFDGAGRPLPSFGRPRRVAGIQPAVAIAAGDDSTCAVDSTGAVTCWGDGYSGASPFVAPPGLPLRGVHAIAMGGTRACGLDAQGLVRCTTSSSELSVPRALEARALGAVATSEEHACALDHDHVLCWGRNEAAEIGSGLPYRAAPVSPEW